MTHPFLRLRPLLVLVVSLGVACVSLEAARVHIVKRGETLTSIAELHGVNINELARANKLRDKDILRRGQRLQIPDAAARFIEHRVAKGESLAVIAKRYQTSVADIRAHNPLSDPDHIVPGQTLRVPVRAAGGSAPASNIPDARRNLPASVQKAINDARVTSGRWKNVVIHHTATTEGSGKGIDRYHREERHMENGLAYHFVIGNGNGMGDGEIFVGNRWTDQLPGGHLSIEALNNISLGVCLVGDFEKKAPTRRQLDSLEALIRALLAKTKLDVEAVTTHRLLQGRNHTQCPGRHFPTDAFVKRLTER